MSHGAPLSFSTQAGLWPKESEFLSLPADPGPFEADDVQETLRHLLLRDDDDSHYVVDQLQCV